MIKVIGSHTNGAHRPSVSKVMIRWKVCDVLTGTFDTALRGLGCGAVSAVHVAPSHHRK